MTMDVTALKTELENNGQGHLLKYWDNLEDEQKERLYKELTQLNYAEINGFYKAAMESLNHASDKLDELLQPLPEEVCGNITRCDKASLQQYENLGEI